MLFVLALLACGSPPDDTASVDVVAPSYAPDEPCAPEIWQVACWSCDPVLEPEEVVVACTYSSDPLLDALEQVFGDYGAWREENPDEDLVISRPAHATRPDRRTS